MKKFFSLVFFIVLLCLFCVSAYGVTPYGYGDDIFSLKMNGNLSDESYWYLYYGKEGSEISTENVYEGKTSLKCNIDTVNESNAAYPFMLHTRSVENKNGIADNDIYCEVYTSSSDEVFNNMTLVVYFDMPDGSQKNFKNFTTEYVNEKWRRNYCVINTESVEGFSRCYVGVLFAKNKELSGSFYIDNIRLKVCPKSTLINDVYVDKNYANLNDIRVFGFDKDGTKKLIIDNSSIEFRVLDGAAEISDNVLVYKDAGSGSVVLEAKILGRTTTFTMNFEKEGVYLGERPCVKDNEVHCTFVNDGDTSEEITGFVLVYSNGTLYNAKMFTETILIAETKLIKEKINVPTVLKNTEIKFFFCNKSGEISGLLDVDYN